MQSEKTNWNCQPIPKFKIGDMVILDTQNIQISHINKSLDHKNLGPFKIIRVINNSAYKLKLPPSISSIFPVFYLWLIHLNNSNLLSRQIISPLPPIWFDKDISLGEYIVEEILDLRINKKKKDSLSEKRVFDIQDKIHGLGWIEYQPRLAGLNRYGWLSRH